MTIDGQPGRLRSPLALEYAERALQHQDINQAIEGIRIWSSPLPSLSEAVARVVHLSLFRDAIVQFVGCFDKSDKQYRLVREDVFPRTGSAEEYFQWLLDLRDTFAAHRFGPLRQAVTGASVVEGAGGAVSVLMALYLGPDVTEAPRLLEFMKFAKDYLDRRVHELQQQLMEEVQAMSPEALAALPRAALNPRNVAASNVRMSRAKFDAQHATRLTMRPRSS